MQFLLLQLFSFLLHILFLLARILVNPLPRSSTKYSSSFLLSHLLRSTLSLQLLSLSALPHPCFPSPLSIPNLFDLFISFSTEAASPLLRFDAFSPFEIRDRALAI